MSAMADEAYWREGESDVKSDGTYVVVEIPALSLRLRLEPEVAMSLGRALKRHAARLLEPLPPGDPT
jgi:hypothetical protein